MVEIHEVEATGAAAAAALFTEATFDRVFADAVFEGRQPGRLFVDDPVLPRGALLARTYDYLLAGEPGEALIAFMRDRPAEAGIFASVFDNGPGASSALYGYVPLSLGWREALDDRFGHELVPEARRAFRFDSRHSERARAWRERIPAGYVVREMDGELAALVDDELDEHVGLFWSGYDAFTDGGFGIAVCASGHPVSACHAIAVSSREANLGVGTAEAHRRLGLAELACSACIAQALERGLVPTRHRLAWRTGSVLVRSYRSSSTAIPAGATPYP